MSHFCIDSRQYPQHHFLISVGSRAAAKNRQRLLAKETLSLAVCFFFFFLPEPESVGVGEQKAVCHILFLSLSLSFS